MIMDMNQTQRNRIPKFTYSGRYNLVDEGHGNFHVEFLSSGTLTITNPGKGKLSDIFLLGAGYNGYGSEGGAGGYRKTYKSVPMGKESYKIAIGQSQGARTSISKNGKTWMTCEDSGAVRADWAGMGISGRSGGHAFNDPSFPLYGGGGGGSGTPGAYDSPSGGAGGGGAGGYYNDFNGKNGWPNHGAGGGAGYTEYDGASGHGSDGILIWRNHREEKAA